MVLRKSPKLTETTFADFFDDKEVVNFNKTNFKLAFSVEQYSDDKLPRDDPDYVMWDVRFKIKKGNLTTLIPLRIHKCTDKDYDSFYTP